MANMKAIHLYKRSSASGKFLSGKGILIKKLEKYNNERSKKRIYQQTFSVSTWDNPVAKGSITELCRPISQH